MLDSIVEGGKHNFFNGGQHIRRAAVPDVFLLQNAWVCFKISCSTWSWCITAVSNGPPAASTYRINTGLWL